MFEGKTDEELIHLLRSTDFKEKDLLMDYLLEKYKGRVRQKAKTLYLIGGDGEDLIQEGMIGLFKALRDYDFSQETAFRGFADICISRQMYTAIDASRRKKHSPLNSYISIFEPVNEEDQTIEACDPGSWLEDPQRLYIEHEDMEGLIREIKGILSPLELQVLELHLQGMDYKAIASHLDKSDKTIDNALQRIKTKVNRLYHKA